MENKKRYIYNWEQAYFYMFEGHIKPIERPQVHFETGKVFFVFNYNQTIEIENKWRSRKI